MRAILISLTAFGLVWAPITYANSMESWSEFENLIKSNKVTNIDEMLTVLPDQYKDNYTLVYRTQALMQESVTPRRPRVIMFGNSGKFILAYNSHKSGKKANRGDVEFVETLSFDPATGKSVLRELRFDGKTVPNFSKVQANAQKCLACHTQSPKGVVAEKGLAVKGLWDPYNSWAGVYGSLSRQGIDFIRLGTTEHKNFQQFLKEKDQNPRYSFLKLETELMSKLPPDAFIRGWDPAKAEDSLTFKAGDSSLPNQMLGMHLAHNNFVRIGHILSNEKVEKRRAVQYLVKGFSLDESFSKPDIDVETNQTNLNNKVPGCMAKIDKFLPENMPKVPFKAFADILLAKIRADYAIRKAAVEFENMGLSKIGGGLDPNDPYDENRSARALDFDSINPASQFHLKNYPEIPGHTTGGLTGNAALFYLMYLLDVPSHDISTAVTRGSNIMVDNNYVLSGSTSLYYGNTTRCRAKGKVKSLEKPYNSKKTCFSEGVEEFFTQYLPKKFYTAPDLDKLNCEQLAEKSRKALTAYFGLEQK